MFIVTVENNGMKFWLRGTTWAFHRDRANEFASHEAAQTAIDKAKQFMAPKIKKNLKIEEEGA